MMKHRFPLGAMACLALMLAVALPAGGGCGTKVKEVQVDNRPVADRDGTLSNLKGMTPEMVAYFRAKYPDGSWDLAPAPPVVAVGPAVFSKSALSLLQADPDAKTPAAGLGDSVSMFADNGKATFVMSQKYSPGAQAAVTEVLTQSGAFVVKAMDDAAGLDLYRGKLQYSNLYEQKVKLFVESNVTADGTADRPLLVFLRLIDTRTGTVVCAVSQSGRDLEPTARTAANLLVSRVASAK